MMEHMGMGGGRGFGFYVFVMISHEFWFVLSSFDFFWEVFGIFVAIFYIFDVDIMIRCYISAFSLRFRMSFCYDIYEGWLFVSMINTKIFMA